MALNRLSFRRALSAGLCALMFGMFAPLAARAENRVALVIGNSDYELSSWRLANPTNDAAAVSAKLEAVGFNVVTVLDADEDTMEDAIRDFRAALFDAGEDAVGLFYFSGHGVQADGRNWLMPVDFAGSTLDDVIGDSVRLGDVLNAMERAGNRMNFVLLDACRNDPLPRATRDAGRGLAAEARQRGMIIAYAAAPGQAALDGVGGTLSPFTQAFVDLIDGPYHAGELFPLIAGRVQAATEGRQQPWVEIGVSAASREDFFYFDPTALDRSANGADVQARLAEELSDLGQTAVDAALRSDGGASLASLAFSELNQPSGRDSPNAARLAEASCDRGLADGCNLLAGIYSEGWGVIRDDARALDLFQRACDGGSVRACGNLGVMYRDGRGVAQDYAKAMEHMRKACDVGEGVQCDNLGEMARDGKGMAPDASAAASYFQKACSLREAAGCLNFGQALAKGEGTPQNTNQAKQLFRDVCGTTNPDDRETTERGCGPLRDLVKAECETKGSVEACHDYGILVLEGRAADRDAERALDILGRACDGGYVPACLTLSQVFAQGRFTPQNLDEAIRRARQAYDLGDRVTAANYLRALGVQP